MNAALTGMVCRPSRIMKPFALSLACPELAEGSKGISIRPVLRQAQHEQMCFTLTGMAYWPPGIMKPFALSLACPELAEGSKGISIRPVLRQAQHERMCFTLILQQTSHP